VIFKKSDKIQFVSTIEGLESIEESLPKPAKHFIPQWFKDIPSNVENSSTVKICPSFPDYFSEGYIIPMWSDVNLRYDKNGWFAESPLSLFPWDNHGNQQFLDYTDARFNGVEGQFMFKAVSPWRIITPPGWSVLQLPLFYHFNQEWSVLPGVVDTDTMHQVNQQVLYHGNGKDVRINLGDPFVLYIPFKRSNKLKHKVLYQTEEHRKLFSKLDLSMLQRFQPNGWYRQMQRNRDKNER
jgi:hypothetical protein